MLNKMIWMFTMFFLLFVYCTQIPTEMPVTTSSKQALTHFFVAQVLDDNLKFEKAIPEYQKAIEIDKNFALAHLNLGFCYFQTGNTMVGFKHFNKAMSLRDKVTEGERLYLDNIQAGFDGDTQKEKKLAAQLVSMFPQDKRLHFNRGAIYANQQDWDVAISELQKTIVIDPRFAPAYNLLAYSFLYNEKFDQAEEMIKKYTDLIPDEANPWDSYAEILLKQGKFEKSVEAYQKSIKMDPGFLMSYNGMGTNYILMQEPEKAMQIFDTWYQKAPDEGQKRLADFAKIRCCIDNQDLDKAINLAELRLTKSKAGDNDLDIAADLNVLGDLYFEKAMYTDALGKYYEANELVQHSELIGQDQKENLVQGYLFDEIRVDIMKGYYEQAREKIVQYAETAKMKNNNNQLMNHHQLLGLLAMQENRLEDAIAELEQANLRNPRNLCCLAQVYRAKGEPEKAKEYCSKAVNFNENNYNWAYVRKQATDLLATL